MNITQHRYRLGVFPVPRRSVDSKVFPLSDPLIPATLGHGKVAQCQILCWFVFTWRKRETTLVFDVRVNSQSHVGHEDLGELLPASASLDPRTEVVLETTVDDARRVRQIPDVNHISQRKVGQNVESASQWICLNL